MDEIGMSSRQQTKKDYDQQINYWQSITEQLEEKIKTNLSNYKRISENPVCVLAYPVCPFA
jgi:hypothetical protein